MTLLEDKIRELKPKPDEPSSGHKQRFEQRLSEHFGNTKSIKWHLPAYAATIILLVSSLTILLVNNRTIKSEIILSLEDAEYFETEIYFQQLVAERLAIIESLDSANEMQIDDFNEFDESLLVLKNDLNEAPGDERIVGAVLNTYMLKIEALDKLVIILKKTS